MIRRPLLTLVVALLLAVGAAMAVARLRIDTSLTSLFDSNDPSPRALDRVTNDFRAVEELLVLVEDSHPTADSPSNLKAFAARLDAAISRDSECSSLCDGVIYRADEQTRSFFEKVVVPNGIFYLTEAEFEAARHRLTPQGMADQLQQDQTLIAAPGPAAQGLAKVLLKDPLRLREFLIDRLAAAVPMKTFGSEAAFISSDGGAILIRVRGKRPVSDIEFSKQLLAAVTRVASHENHSGLKIGYAGGYAIAAISATAIRSDMIWSVIGSCVSLQLLFILAYSSPIRSFLLAFAPVALGVLLGFGVYALAARQLSPMTAVIGGILAGMAIDYAINFLAYYSAGCTAGRSSADAALLARRGVASPLLAAWATSVVGFVAISASHVRALRDFSLLGSFGLTGAFLCALLVLPALLAFTGRGAGNVALQRWRVTPLLACLRRRRLAAMTVTAVIAIIALAALVAPGTVLPLESDLTVMHPRPNSALETQDRIAKRFGVSPDTMIVHLSADSETQLLHLAHEVAAQLRDPSIASAGVGGFFGPANLLPDPQLFAARMAATGQAYADRVIADFRAATAQTLFDPAAFKPYEEFLRVLLTAARPPDLATLRQYPTLADLILPTRGNHLEAITLVFLRNPSERRELRDSTIDAVRSALHDLDGVTLTGVSIMNHDTEQTVRRDLPRLVLLSIGIVIAYLLLHFRDVIDGLLAVLPAIVGLACLLAFMRLSGQKLNMINLVAFPLLIGIDVDYGVFVVAAARRSELRGLPPDQVIARLSPPVSAVILCAVATTLGFGSLAFTSIPAARSLGIAVAVGVVSCLTATLLLVVPILLLLASRPSRKHQ